MLKYSEKCKNNLLKSVVCCYCGYDNVLILKAVIKNLLENRQNSGNNVSISHRHFFFKLDLIN